MSSSPSSHRRSSRRKSQAKTSSTPRGAAFEVTEKAAAAPGLTAVTERLKELPGGIGAAIVVIQHLDPEHRSLTREMLSRISPLPVSEVTHGMRIEPGHVYVIPPNCSLRLSSNEELQSTNEELQSTSEELETANEELQAANEELTTINDELQARNTEMAQLVAIEDLTARRSADRLRRAEENYRLLLENAHDGILIVNQTGDIELVNRRFEEMFGYASGELNNKPYTLLISDQSAEALRKYHAEFMRNPEARDIGQAVDLFGKRKDGSIIPLEISLSPVKVDSNVMVTAIVRDVSMRKQIEEERQALLVREAAARREAERANQVKDEFLATLSHELRTPLSTILIRAQILRLKGFDVEETRRAVALIEKSAKEQSQLIEDLLDISRIQVGNVRLQLREIEPTACVVAALDSVRSLATVKSITIQTEFDPSPCWIAADSNRLQQVFRNLLENAIKFTLPGGKVTVRSRQLKDSGRLEIQVQDTGKGIRPEFLPYVFKRFSQEDASTTRAFGGLGLGLSIVRNLVEMHGGTVTADSPGQGKGAVFTVTLPCASAALANEVVATSGALQSTARDTEKSDQLNGFRVLVIDDLEDARTALSALLESLGAQVQSVGSAPEGLEALARNHPDAVLCDIAMPGEDGFSVIRKVRALEPGQGGKVPMVALTAYAERESFQRCLDAGFDAYQAKPADIVDLARLIVELVGRPKPRR